MVADFTPWLMVKEEKVRRGCLIGIARCVVLDGKVPYDATSALRLEFFSSLASRVCFEDTLPRGSERKRENL
jgi:hypothetical protein